MSTSESGTVGRVKSLPNSCFTRMVRSVPSVMSSAKSEKVARKLSVSTNELTTNITPSTTSTMVSP